MKADILKSIQALSGVTNVIVLTHNIDFIFLQTVVIAALNRSGTARITVFADAQCAEESYAAQHGLISGLGTRYRVVSVPMATGFRFHPKAVMLSGQTDATLFVGSGNLTFGGWSENAEVWSRFDASRDGLVPFRDFERFMEDVLGRLALAEAIRHHVHEAFDGQTRTWANGDVTEGGPPTLMGRVGHGPALIGALVQEFGPAPVDELYVCSPYFDATGIALSQLRHSLAPANTTVLYQPRGSTLSQAACNANPGLQLRHITFEREDTMGHVRQSFVHAKFYGVVRAEELVIVAGSANCSVAALSLSGQQGNAELMAMRRMPAAEFREHWLDELRTLEEVAVPPEAPPDELDDGPARSLRVLAARVSNGKLRVAYAPASAHVVECLIDQAPVAFTVLQVGMIDLQPGKSARMVSLIGRIADEEVRSSPSWIDDEKALGVSYLLHPGVEAIKGKAREGHWNKGAWQDVLNTFCKHLTNSVYPTPRGCCRSAPPVAGVG